MRRLRGRTTACAVLLVTLVSWRATAQRASVGAGAQAGELLLAAGVINVLDGGAHDGLLLSLEYRPPMAVWRIRPLLSFSRASGGSMFSSAGAVLAVPLGDQWELSGGFAPTHYVSHGRQDLGHMVEFYSFAELVWRRASGAGLRGRFGHISNAGLGLINPGAEIAQLHFSIPLGAMRRN